MNNCKIAQAPGHEEVPTEIIAQSIKDISDAMKKINSGRLKQDAIVVLLQDVTRLPKKHIKMVLDAMECLQSIFLKPKKS